MTVSIYQKIKTWGWRGVVDFFRRKFFYHQMCAWFRRNAKRYPMTPIRGVTIIADLTSPASLSKTMRDLVLMLKKANIPFQTFDLGQDPSRISAADYEDLITPKRDFRMLKYDHVVEMFGGPFPEGLPIKRSRIAFWEFESGLLEYYPTIADDVDEIIGMSDYDVTVFRKQLPACVGVRKLLYPFLFDVGELPPSVDVRDKYGIGRDEFVVFFNFDFGSSFGRKNPDGVLRAFAKAFGNVAKTRLVFKTKGAKSHPNDLAKLQALAEELCVTSQLTFINSFIPMKDIYGLTNACDVYISLHRGEGFGLGVAEAMSLAKPVIVTDYSSTTEFCNSTNAIPIPYRIVNVPAAMHDHACYHAVKQWAEADIDAAAEALKKLYSDPELRMTLGRNAKAFIADYFSVANFKKSIDEFLGP